MTKFDFTLPVDSAVRARNTCIAEWEHRASRIQDWLRKLVLHYDVRMYENSSLRAQVIFDRAQSRLCLIISMSYDEYLLVGHMFPGTTYLRDAEVLRKICELPPIVL